MQKNLKIYGKISNNITVIFGEQYRYKVYPKFIPDGDNITSKISMTIVESKNSRLRHYLA